MDRSNSEKPRRRLTRVEAKAKTREQLLAAAERVFAQKGLAGASVEEIAEDAGYSTGALYSNFESKEQLFLELMAARRARGAATRVSAVSGMVDEVGTGNDDPLAALTRFFVQMTERYSEFAPLEAEFWLYAVRNPEAMGGLAATRHEQLDALEGLVGQALQRFGSAPTVSVRAVTTVVVALFEGLVRQRRIDPEHVADDLFAQAVRWLFSGTQSSSLSGHAPAGH
ncbi:MAG: TetR/AcrR family transcriptional regulator [Thermoleophilia bacterium]